MFGNKKLSTIRKEIAEALGDDPIQELELQITNAKRKGEGTEVIEGLKRFFVPSPARQRRTRRTTAKK